MELNLKKQLTDKEKRAIGSHFELKCSEIKTVLCPCCMRVGINLQIGNKGVCKSCGALGNTKYFETKGALPIWHQDGTPQFHIPEELACLSLAEKMLIQRASPFIPLRHIKNGIFGIAGHVCTFPQDIAEFANKLPRHKNDVTMISVLKTVQTEIGSDQTTNTTTYRVNKKKVGKALKWLKENNTEYKSIEIDMSALDWLDGDEGDLQSILIEPEDDEMLNEHDEILDQNMDNGPNPRDAIINGLNGDNVKDFGYVTEGGPVDLAIDDVDTQMQLEASIANSTNKKNISVKWPTRDVIPISEFNATKLFAQSYPWLFPGGIGDVAEYPGTPKEWGEHMLRYQDGRFSKDKFFVFFAMNYIVRNRNSKAGSWFMREFNKGGPETLDDLKECIDGGDTRFINSLTYYSKCVKGSTSYWHQKRSELYAWINHHVEVGNGPPTMFITLSCAEHYWPDIIELLQERMRIAGDDPSTCYQGSPKMNGILNDYALVVQEYFQARVDIWMATVGKHVLNIKHHWMRFEFAPGRGQIHVHMVAIPYDHDIYRLCHADLQEVNGQEKRAERLAKWAKDTMGMTASVEDGFDLRNQEASNSPTSFRLTDLNITEDDYLEDKQELLKYCQVHDCSGFCLRTKSGSK